MGENLPLLVAFGLAAVWIAVIFYGVESLYRRKSPVYIIYWGSWICFTLWYLKWMKDPAHFHDKMHWAVKLVLYIAFLLGALFGAFSTTKAVRQRYKDKG